MPDGTYSRKISLTRLPIRLGRDVFSHYSIGPRRAAKLIQVLTGFNHLMAAYAPLAYRACATSAMLQASNQAEICESIHKNSGIAVEVIERREEDRLTFSKNHDTLPEGKDAQI